MSCPQSNRRASVPGYADGIRLDALWDSPRTGLEGMPFRRGISRQTETTQMTISQGDTESTGIGEHLFKPVAYALHRQKVSDLPLVAQHHVIKGEELPASTTFDDVLRCLDGRRERQAGQTAAEIMRSWTEQREQEIPTTVGAILQGFAARHIRSIEAGHGRLCVTTNTTQVMMRGSRFSIQVLATLLTLQKEGVDAFCTTWFFYDEETDVYVDEYVSFATEIFSFFVVHEDKIAREHFSFRRHETPDGFDPAIFTELAFHPFAEGGSERPHRGWNDAYCRLWYSRFYEETRIGQLMVLRSDEPALYHYPEGLRIRSVYAAADNWPLLSDELTARITSELGPLAPAELALRDWRVKASTTAHPDDARVGMNERPEGAPVELADLQALLSKIHRVLWLLASGR